MVDAEPPVMRVAPEYLEREREREVTSW